MIPTHCGVPMQRTEVPSGSSRVAVYLQCSYCKYRERELRSLNGLLLRWQYLKARDVA